MNDRSAPIRLGVGGAGGRMGAAVIALVEARADLALAAVFDRPGAPGMASAEEAIAGCDAIIDFSTPAASVELAQAAAAHGAPALVIGATGFSGAEEAAVARAAAKVAIVKSGNYSLGVNILAGLVEETSRRLAAADWDIEIAEAHHRRKLDAPSGTALMLGEAAARGRGQALPDLAVRGRDGLTGPRPAGAIGFSSLRAGGIVGEHAVTFAAEDEILTLSHSARDRALFARGALTAALWAIGREPGLYDMADVLGFGRKAPAGISTAR